MVERSKCMNVPEIRFKEFCDYYSDILYNPQIEMFARFKMKSSFHKTKRII